jgi:hypothetical protein
MGEYKNIQNLYEDTVLNGRSNALDESRGGYLINMLGELEEAFNTDAGFYNGKYQDSYHPEQSRRGREYYLDQKNHKAMLNALKNLSKAMQKGYKGKLIGF